MRCVWHNAFPIILSRICQTWGFVNITFVWGYLQFISLWVGRWFSIEWSESKFSFCFCYALPSVLPKQSFILYLYANNYTEHSIANKYHMDIDIYQIWFNLMFISNRQQWKSVTVYSFLNHQLAVSRIDLIHAYKMKAALIAVLGKYMCGTYRALHLLTQHLHFWTQHIVWYYIRVILLANRYMCIRQQAITRANIGPDLCCRMASQGHHHNDLMAFCRFRIPMLCIQVS